MHLLFLRRESCILILVLTLVPVLQGFGVNAKNKHSTHIHTNSSDVKNGCS